MVENININGELNNVVLCEAGNSKTLYYQMCLLKKGTI